MARPVRVNVRDGWYHAMSRGIERRTIFRGDRYCEHFLDLLEEMSARYAVQVHAYVLMGNHYHLLLRTPEANASAALQWLNVSYSAWFNAKQERVGHVLQGRFRSTLIDGEGSWLLEASAYLHLNPVRVSALGLGKAANRAEAAGLVVPDQDLIRRRLEVLRSAPWSSYRAYAGYATAPTWLVMEELWRRAGAKTGYRRFVERYVRRGMETEGFEALRDRVAIGGAAFQSRVRSWAGQLSGEQPARSQLYARIPYERVVRVVERVKGEPWDAFGARRGDWGHPLVLHLARLYCGLTLRQIAEHAGGGQYKTVGKRIERFAERLRSDRALRGVTNQCRDELSHVET